LSEGINLQDGQVVINYDLHWNPVRIIQRVGRIDRIGSPHSEIFLYNFFPETKADQEINITQKINKRIDEIIENFGYDEKTIRMDEKTIRKRLFDILSENPTALEEKESGSTSKYFELEFRKLKEKYPEEYQKAMELPALSNIARASNKKGILVFCRADDFFSLMLVDKEGKLVNSDRWKLLKMLKANLSDRGKNFNHKYFYLIEKVREEFEKEANKREYDKEQITDPVKKEFSGLIKWLKRRATKEIKEKLSKLEDFVNERELSHEQGKMIRRISRSYKKKFGLDKKQILGELESQIYPSLKNSPEIKKPEIKPRYAQVIIAEELI
jgi:superfamily II DNA/RNA helicase